MATTQVSTNAALNTALAGASGGDIINCDQGVIYSVTTARVYGSEVIIQSTDPNNPAEFFDIGMSGAQNMTFKDLLIRYYHQSGQGARVKAAELIACTDVEFRNCVFQGGLAVENGTGSPAQDEVFTNEPVGRALAINGCTRCGVVDCDFFHWWKAVVFNSNNGSSLDCYSIGCNYYLQQVDSISVGVSTGTVVRWNWVHDIFDSSILSLGHPDFTQMQGSSGAQSGLIYEHNILDKGSQPFTQGLFSGVDGRGPTEFHLNPTIRYNIFYLSQTHAITLNKFDGGLVEYNTIYGVPKDAAQTGTGFTPQINLANGTKNLTVQFNITPGIGEDSNEISLCTVENNSTILVADYGTEVDQLSTGAVEGYNQFQFKTGGTLISAGHGAQNVNDSYPFDNLTWIRNRGVLGGRKSALFGGSPLTLGGYAINLG